jgi:hypothetical protein
MTNSIGRVALLWRGDRQARDSAKPETSRLHRVFEALASRILWSTEHPLCLVAQSASR